MRTILLIILIPFLHASVDLGVDVFFKEQHYQKYLNKRVGLITNQTGVNRNQCSTIDLFKQHSLLIALFAPEHGLNGHQYAWEKVIDQKGAIPVYSLHGKTRRPTAEMLQNLDTLVYDIQDIGVRSYTYATTLFYAMEEAAKHNIEIVVLDRPNPINGLTVDGMMLEPSWRSYIGYVNIPYCHGMTIGELARLFNAEYKINCKLTVIPMRGWKRNMSYSDTGLNWVPTSPHIPEENTPYFYATTGILGELDLVNIGIGYTLPFKVIGATWIDADLYAAKLNAQHLPGVHFKPFHYRPFYGSLKGKDCHGVLIQVTDSIQYRPLTIQYMLLGILKSLYPQKVKQLLSKMSESKKKLFCKACGNDEMWRIITQEKFIAWKLIKFQSDEREAFMEKRSKYLIYKH